MNIEDLSKCQCEAPGFCPIFNKEMGTDPPNWQWCQGCGVERRKKYLETTSKENRVIKQAKDKSKVSIVSFYDEILPPKSKFAVCVIPANELASRLLDITRKSIQDYANRCEADYIELSGDQHPDWPMANKFRLHGVVLVYKKTLYLDCDVLVLPNAPNIFEVTPDDKISAYDEYPSWEEKKLTDWIKGQQEEILHRYCDKKTQDRLIDNGGFEPSSMINGGVMVIPQSCAKYYQQPKKEYPRHWCFDQNLLTLTLPQEKFHLLEKEWNLEYVLGDAFWYHLPDAHFAHINSLRTEPEFRKFLLQQISCGDFTEAILGLFHWYKVNLPPIVDTLTKPHKEFVVTDTFKSNHIGIVFNHLSPGGSTVWLKDFVKCFKEEVTGIFSLGNREEDKEETVGLDRGFSLDELYELYAKSDVMLYWICDPNTITNNDDMDYFPDFIWKNPLNKRIIFLCHGGLRISTNELLIKMLKPNVSVFIDPYSAKLYNGVCIPPAVREIEGLIRTPAPKNILWHHRMEHYKGVATLRELIQTLPDFTFHVAASWSRSTQPPEIVDCVENGILGDKNGNVFYYGHMAQEDMKPLFENCSLSLSTSHDESFGLSVAESIINGVPSVSHAAGVGRYSDRVVRYCANPSEWGKEIRLCEAHVGVAKNRDYFLSRFSLEEFEKEWRKVLC